MHDQCYLSVVGRANVLQDLHQRILHMQHPGLQGFDALQVWIFVESPGIVGQHLFWVHHIPLLGPDVGSLAISLVGLSVGI